MMIAPSKKRQKGICLLCAVILMISGVPISVVSQENMGKGRITGTVVDESGNPLAEATIFVESLQGRTKLEGKSDKKGHFAVAGMGTGFWRITAFKTGYVSASLEMSLRQLAANPPVSFTLKKLTGVAALAADKESSQLLDQGNALFKEGKYDAALAVFEEFMTKFPELYPARLNIASCYLKKAEVDKAEAEFQAVLEKTLANYGDYKKDAQTSFRAFTGLGEVYIQKGDFDTSQKFFSQGLEISPEDEVAAYNVGEVFFAHQKIDEAISYLELAVKIKKDWPKPYLKLGYVYLNKGDFTKSLENFNKFVQMDPENPEIPQVKNIIATIEKMKK